MSETPKYTMSGKWYVEQDLDGPCVYAEDGDDYPWAIATIHTGVRSRRAEGDNSDDADANAALIASAPALAARVERQDARIAALEGAIRDWLAVWGKNVIPVSVYNERIAAMRDALAASSGAGSVGDE